MNEEERKFYLEAIERAKTIALEEKENDYNTKVELSDYWIYGAKSIIHELHKKVLRLVSLEANGFNNKCESALDTCLDLINYAAFLYIYLKKWEKGEV